MKESLSTLAMNPLELLAKLFHVSLLQFRIRAPLTGLTGNFPRTTVISSALCALLTFL